MTHQPWQRIGICITLALLTACGDESGGNSNASVPTGNAPTQDRHTTSTHALKDKIDHAAQQLEHTAEKVTETAAKVTEQVAEKAEQAVEAVVDQGKETASKASDQTKQKIAAFVDQATAQLDTQRSNLASLKSMVGAKADDTMKDLISQLGTKLGSAKGVLDRISNTDASSFDALKGEFSTIMGQVKTLYDQAMEKAASLTSGEGLDTLKNAAEGLMQSK